MSQEDKEAGGGEGEDIEAFLKSLEETDVPDTAPAQSKPVATAPDTDDLDARFEALNDLVPDDLPAKQKKGPVEEKDDGKKKSRKERAADKKEAKARAKQEKIAAKDAAIAATPAWKRALKKGTVWAIMMLPMLVFAWILGAFLAHVISAGWLIALLMLVVAVGFPLLVAKLSKRGKVAWWAAGLGILLTAALVAPMPTTVGNTLTHYGHWPTAMVGEIAGWAPDSPLSRVGGSVAGLVGSALNAEVKEPMRLGTMDRLDGSVAPETLPDAQPPQDGVGEAKPEAPESVTTPE